MLTLIGLGPTTTQDGLSLGAWEALRSASGLKLTRSRTHPAILWLESNGVMFDAYLDTASAEDAVMRVLDAARTGDVCYAVPDHPLMGDPTCIPLLDAVRREDISPARLRPSAPARRLACRL